MCRDMSISLCRHVAKAWHAPSELQSDYADWLCSSKFDLGCLNGLIWINSFEPKDGAGQRSSIFAIVLAAA
jgi:hypothetical protein